LGICVVLALLLIGVILLLVLGMVREKRKQRKEVHNNQNMTLTDAKRTTVVIESDMNTEYVPDETSANLTYISGSPRMKREPGPIPLNELEIGKEIGQGKYGRVCVGKWKKYRVALKFCQNRGTMNEFMREANLMITLPPHPNVVQMYGVSIDGTQPIIVMEYCAGGSLNKVLFDRRQHISDDVKIRWTYEIALGMSHLHKHNIVHRDLAARNILLTQAIANGHAKISDFGMSRILREDTEAKTAAIVGPIPWMAPESLKKQVYSKKTDIWMFGILVYEIVARNEPHKDENIIKVSQHIRDHSMNPGIPQNCPPKLQDIMQACWNVHPEQRPTFEIICQMLTQNRRPTSPPKSF